MIEVLRLLALLVTLGSMAFTGAFVPPDDVDVRGQAALAQVSYDWERALPGWSIEFKPRTGQHEGLTYVNERRIEVYIDEDTDEARLAHVVAHEIGHALDVTLNTEQDRQVWCAARSFACDLWWPESGRNDFSSGAGDFAEAFASMEGSPMIFSRLAGAPTPEQLDTLATLIGATP